MKVSAVSRVALAFSALLYASFGGVGTFKSMEAQAAEPRVIRALTPGPRADYWHEAMFEFIDRVNARVGDRLQIRHIGHSDVVPAFEQFEALYNGVVDVILTYTSYYTGQVPEALSQLYSTLSPAELRESGYYDLMREIHRDRANVVYLANVGGAPGRAFRFYLNKEVKEPDFSGMRIRVSASTAAFAEALGAAPVVMPAGEIYTSLERGVIDGYGWPYGGTAAYGWHEVTKYAIDHGFYTANNVILFNGEVWDSLEPDLRAEIEEIAKELEVWAFDFMEAKNEEDNEILRKAGVQLIQFDEENRKRYNELALDAAWKAFAKANSEEMAARLRALVER